MSEYLNKNTLEPPYAIIFTAYWLKGVGNVRREFAGHTVGMCTNSYTHWENKQTIDGPVFFDSNYGFCTFTTGDMGAEMETHMKNQGKKCTRGNTVVLKFGEGS